MTIQEVKETLLEIQCSNKELTSKQVDALAIAIDLIKRAKMDFIECIEREKLLNGKNFITVQTREYGSIEVIPVDTIADIESVDVQPTKEQTELQLAYNKQMIELREAKRLLKLAIEDMYYALSGEDEICKSCICDHNCYNKDEYECIKHGCDVCAKWRYADEALKLIGGNEND